VDLLAGGIAAPSGAAIIRDDRLLIADSFAESGLGYTREVDDDTVTLRAYGHVWVFRDGQRVCSCDGQTMDMSTEAVVIGEEFYCPARPLLEPLGGRVYEVEDGRFGLELPRAHVLNIRQGSHGDKVRVVIDLSRPVPFQRGVMSSAIALRIPLLPDPEGRHDLIRQLDFSEQLVPTITESHENDWAQITISHISPEAPALFTLADPARIVIDLMRPEPIVEPQAVTVPEQPPAGQTDGISWRLATFATGHGPVRAWVVTVDPTDRDVIVRPALAASTIHHRRTVKSIAQREVAYAAVNGGFFAPRGQPLGMLVIEGEWITTPLYQRAVLGFSKAGKPEIRNVGFDGWVEFVSLGRLPLEGLNRGHVADDGVVVYTPRWGDSLAGSTSKTRVVVSGGVVQSVLTGGEAAPIPEDGFVVSGLGRRAQSLKQVKVGQPASLDLSLKPAWPGVWHAIGGGPRLLSAGQFATSYYDERFQSDVTASIRPRTAAGIDKDGKLLLLVVEGANRGMSLAEVAGVMSKLGAVDAMNLDGGGSSTLVIAGKYRNHPSDGAARSVSNAIVIQDRQACTAAGGK